MPLDKSEGVAAALVIEFAPMQRAVVLSVVLVFVGCKSERLKTTEAELAAAKARVATMDTRRADMVKELNTIEGARRKAAKDADATEYAITRLSGALQVLDGKPVPDGLLLDDALKSKSPELGRLAATIVQRQLPCVSDDEQSDEPEDQRDGCEPPPPPDACEGVPPRTVQDFSWSCVALDERKGAPTVAICSSMLSGHEVGALRLAFLHQGRIIVGDYPAPSVELYQPENVSEISACNDANAVSSCESTCDSRFGHNDCYDPYEGIDYGNRGDDDDDNDESAELRAARIAAQEAAATAEYAAGELAYQECRAGCASTPEEEAEVLPSEFDYVDTIAPGVFQFRNRTGPDADGGYDEGDAIISFPTYNQVLADNFETDEDDVQGLSLELYSDEGIVTDKPADGALLMAGYHAPNVTGIKVFLDGKTPVSTLSTADTCAFVERMKNKRLIELCTKQLAEETERAEKRAAAAARADAGIADAGVPAFDGGVDAGGAP